VKVKLINLDPETTLAIRDDEWWIANPADSDPVLLLAEARESLLAALLMEEGS
jgi:hypothetical protein